MNWRKIFCLDGGYDEVPPWDFQEEAGQPMALSEEGVPQWRCCFLTNNVRLGSSRSRLWQRTCCGITDKGDGVSVGDHQSVSSVPCDRHLLSSLRRGSCRDRSRCLGQVHIPLSLRCPVCSAEPGNWSELQQHLAEHLCDVFKNDGLQGRRVV